MSLSPGSFLLPKKEYTMTIKRKDQEFKLTSEELFQAYEEQKLLLLLNDVKDLFRNYMEFRKMNFPEKQKAVKAVAKTANSMITAKGYNSDTAIILSIENYLKEMKAYA